MLAAKTLINPSPPLNLPNKLTLRRPKPPFSLSIRNSLSDSQAPTTPGQLRVDILSESLPFIQKFRGKTIVVKYGGAAMKSESLQASVVNDLVLLSCVGLRPVLVHGGGPEINHWLKRLNIEVSFHDGLRVTDAATMEIARVDPTVLWSIVNDGHIPVIASVAADETGQQYNINADTVAGELAAALGAEKLILLTDVAGILSDRNDASSLVKEIDIKGVKKMVEEGTIGGGMIPKVNCCVRSLAQGVRTASIVDGRVPHSLLLEILTDEGAGTMISG
ncbi:PREDICTED: acetylglutamate kinase, chloroplastic [Prunus mume]|uniref:Acetylglutamate kinase, chloroplastic n=1 Tax=Prunus mume TaxID=102107 RepID=A0ABM0N5M7_PRUMU|nr:PREDICTED: acetylglutamate kinase, chloroplastic [Prunus mume]